MLEEPSSILVNKLPINCFNHFSLKLLEEPSDTLCPSVPVRNFYASIFSLLPQTHLFSEIIFLTVINLLIMFTPRITHTRLCGSDCICICHSAIIITALSLGRLGKLQVTTNTGFLFVIRMCFTFWCLPPIIPYKYVLYLFTSWDELSLNQAEAVNLNLASRYSYNTSINQAIWKRFDFYHLHQTFSGFLRKRRFPNLKISFWQIFSPFLGNLEHFRFLWF